MQKMLALAMIGCLTLAAGCGMRTGPAVNDAAYRPAGEGNAQALFRQRLGDTSITVFPTVVRSVRGSAYDKASRDRIVDFLKAEKLATVVEADEPIDLSKSVGTIQQDIFQSSLALVAGHVRAEPTAIEYALLVECLVTPSKPGGEAVGGIQCYLLDSEGNNAFSFLLNSHHRLFNEAQLSSPSPSADARAKLIDRATGVVLEAFRRQLER